MPRLSLTSQYNNERALTNVLIAKRQALGKTQYQIAQEIGVDQTTISSVECRISNRMGWLTFAKIIHAYGLDIDYVMETRRVCSHLGPNESIHVSPASCTRSKT